MEPVRSNIQLERRGASGLEIHVPPDVTRAPRFAVIACLYAVAFVGATVIWAWVAIMVNAQPLLRILSFAFLVPFVIVDFVLIVAAINSLLRQFRVEVGGDAITITDYWLVLRWQEIRVPMDDITRIEHRATGSAGEKQYYSLMVHYRQDTTPREATLASAIPGKREAQWLADEIRAALPTSRRP